MMRQSLAGKPAVVDVSSKKSRRLFSFILMVSKPKFSVPSVRQSKPTHRLPVMITSSACTTSMTLPAILAQGHGKERVALDAEVARLRQGRLEDVASGMVSSSRCDSRLGIGQHRQFVGVLPVQALSLDVGDGEVGPRPLGKGLGPIEIAGTGNGQAGCPRRSPSAPSRCCRCRPRYWPRDTDRHSLSPGLTLGQPTRECREKPRLKKLEKTIFSLPTSL